MVFRFRPSILAVLAVLLAASLVIAGCGGTKTKTNPAQGQITSAAVFPSEIPAAGGTVTVLATTTGNVEPPTIAIVPTNGAPGMSHDMVPVNGIIDPLETQWVANGIPVDPNTGNDVYCVATVSGFDTTGVRMTPKSSNQIILYGTGSDKPNIVLWGEVKNRDGAAVPLQTIKVERQVNNDWVTVSTPRAYKDGLGRFQIPFIGSAGYSYRLSLDGGPEYYLYQKVVTPQLGANPKISVTVDSTATPPPPPNM